MSRTVAAAATCMEGHHVASNGETKNRQPNALDTAPG